MTTSYQSTCIWQVTDCIDDDAVAKVSSAYELHKGRAGLFAPLTSVLFAPESIAAGTKVSELINLGNNRPDNIVIAVNYAPPDKKEGTKNNARRDFFAADLGDNIVVCGTSNGLEFSYIKPLIKSFYRIADSNILKSQFRSWEVLPERTVAFSQPALRTERLKSGTFVAIDNIDDIVPDVPDITHVFQIDEPFHNIKLYASRADLALLEQLAQGRQDISIAFGRSAIEIGNAKITQPRLLAAYAAVTSETLFEPAYGTTVLARTSSSTRNGGIPIPIIATIRPQPGITSPTYERHLPPIGAPVFLSAGKPPLLTGSRFSHFVL